MQHILNSKKYLLCIVLLLSVLGLTSCKKDLAFGRKPIVIEGYLVNPLNSEYFANRVVQLTAGNVVLATATTDERGYYSFDEQTKEEYCYLISPDFQGVMADKNGNGFCKGIEPSKEVQYVNYYISFGKGFFKMKFNKTPEDTIEDVVVDTKYPNSLPTIHPTKIFMYTDSLLDNMIFSLLVGECIIDVSYIKNGVVCQTEKHLSIEKDQTLFVEID